MRLSYILWIFLLPLPLLASKMYIYVGQSTDSGDAFKIYAMSDINLIDTYIHINDFRCAPENSCTIDPELYLSSYHGIHFHYQWAYLQVNLLMLPFEDQLRVKYIVDHRAIQNSILGFSPNSTFFQYFAYQNYLHELRISFYFDWENVVYFRSDVYDSAKLPVNVSLEAVVQYYRQAEKPPVHVKYCLANQASLVFQDNCYFRVRKDVFDDWATFLAQTKKESNNNVYGNIKYNVTFNLFNNEYANLGKMEYLIDDLVDDRGTVNVQPFDDDYDEGRGCDVYIGLLSLRKFNYKFYYSEGYVADYSFSFVYDGIIGLLSDQENAASLLWLQMIFFVIVFSFISFLAYEYILKKNEDVGLRDEDLSIPGEENEEREFAETKFKITKEEIALLEKKIN